MRLTIIGSGTCVPSVKRGSPANLLQINKKNILLDCGPGTLRQLEHVRVSYKDVDMVFFTHFHSDHIGDLNPFIQALRWTPGYVRKRNLTLIGPVGLRSFYKRYCEPISGKPTSFKIVIKEIRNELRFSNFAVKSIKTPHSKESIAYRFTNRNKSLVITGDCDFDDSLIKFSQQSDILVLECSFANRYKTVGHLIPRECGMIAREAGVKKLILTHIYPPIDGRKRLQETKKIFKNTFLAEDFKSFSI